MFMQIEPRAQEAISKLILNEKLIEFLINRALGSGGYFIIDTHWKTYQFWYKSILELWRPPFNWFSIQEMVKLHVNRAQSSRVNFFIDFWLNHHQFWYKSSLELWRLLFAWFLIEKLSIVMIWSLELWGPLFNWFLIINYENDQIHVNGAWSSGISFSIDLELTNHQFWYKSSPELWSPLFDWFLIETSSIFIWIEPGALEATF